MIYYSPRTSMDGGTPLQAFTAIGRVADEHVYEFPMRVTFVPFRRNIEYEQCLEVPIYPLRNRLSFIQNKEKWGYPFRTGHFEIGRDDFLTIAVEMGMKAEAFR